MAEPDQPQSPDPGRKRIPGEVLAFVLSLIWLVLHGMRHRSEAAPARPAG